MDIFLPSVWSFRSSAGIVRASTGGSSRIGVGEVRLECREGEELNDIVDGAGSGAGAGGTFSSSVSSRLFGSSMG